MKRLFLWNGKEVEEGAGFDISTLSMNALVKAGLFKLPTCTTHDNHKAIDLKIFIVRVQRMIGAEVSIKDRVTIVRALAQYRYLRWYDDDAAFS